MMNLKKLGIYMDHSSANIIAMDETVQDPKTIDSKFTNLEKEITVHKGESHLHNKQNHEQAAFYKDIENEIINFDVVLLFGPTNAKTELFNIISEDHKFAKIRIEVATTDKLPENQQRIFAKDFFLKLI